MQANYNDLTFEGLVGLLTEKTAILTRLYTENPYSQEYFDCKVTVQNITEEIEFRKKNQSSTEEPKFE